MNLASIFSSNQRPNLIVNAVGRQIIVAALGGLSNTNMAILGMDLQEEPVAPMPRGDPDETHILDDHTFSYTRAIQASPAVLHRLVPRDSAYHLRSNVSEEISDDVRWCLA